MNKLYLVICLCFFYTPRIFAKSYGFDDLLGLAKKNSIDAEIAKTRALELESEIQKIKAGYYPNLKAVIGSEKRDARSEPDVNKSNFVAELRVEQSIFKFGATSKKISALRAEKEHYKNSV